MQTAGNHIRDQLETVFKDIGDTRMEGVPILNPAISVQSFGFDPYDEFSLGVLLTPWFMNLMLVPQDRTVFASQNPVTGEKRTVPLPVGDVEFITAYEPSFGHYLSCSLFSPVFEFADQAAAVETAEAALKAIFGTPDSTDENADMRAVWAGRVPEPATAEENVPVLSPDVSRRQFFRGELGAGAKPEVQP